MKPISCLNRWALILCGAAFFPAAPPRAHGEPVYGDVFSLRQPDGSRVDVRIWGDEFYRVVESLDGYTLVRDPDSGFACYARLLRAGDELVSTGVPVGAAQPADLGLAPHLRISSASADAKIAAARARFAEGDAEVLRGALRGGLQPSPPSSGNVQGICLIVDFSDQPATIPASEIDNHCNQIGYTGYGNNGSVRDYFYDVSDGYLTYTNFVPANYYRAQHPKSYYEDPSIPFGTRARQLVLEALNDLDSQGFDFSQYDSNGDGLVDAVNCYYAGTRSGGWSEGLWPHSWTVSFSADGVSTYRYQITDIQNSLRLATFCHENGHMICYWPDLYDYGGESRGVGRFCIMCSYTSSTNPQHPCAYLKYFSGWSATTVLTTPQFDLPVPSGVNSFYKYEHPTNSNEYYIIENRQRSGRDSGLPDDGLAIWHIDTNGSNNNEQQTPQSHYEATLVQADGDWDLENDRNSGDSTDLWASPWYSECTPDTNPNTNWWSGAASGLFIREISGSGPTMTFSFGDITDCNGNGIPDDQDIAGGYSDDVNANGIPDECEDCDGSGLPDECDVDCAAAGGNCNVAGCGLSPDCNGNGVPDECDISGGTSEDCDGSSIPDECEPDVHVTLVAYDFETAPGWTVSGDATEGQWERGVPVGGGDRGDPPTDYDGSGQCWLTGNTDGDSDVEGGLTILTSPALDLSGADDPQITYARWFSNDTGENPNSKVFTASVSADDGASWVTMDYLGPGGPEVSGGWFVKRWRILDFVPLTSSFKVKFQAFDSASQPSIIEAAVDAFEIFEVDCTGGGLPGDFDGDGDVDLDDFGSFSACYNGSSRPPAATCPPGIDADLDADGDVDLDDFAIFAANYTGNL